MDFVHEDNERRCCVCNYIFPLCFSSLFKLVEMNGIFFLMQIIHVSQCNMDAIVLLAIVGCIFDMFRFIKWILPEDYIERECACMCASLSYSAVMSGSL